MWDSNNGNSKKDNALIEFCKDHAFEIVSGVAIVAIGAVVITAIYFIVKYWEVIRNCIVGCLIFGGIISICIDIGKFFQTEAGKTTLAILGIIVVIAIALCLKHCGAISAALS